MERMEGLQVLEVLDREICGKYRTVAGWDPSKIVVSTMRAEDFHGEELAETLRRKYHLEMEMTARVCDRDDVADGHGRRI